MKPQLLIFWMVIFINGGVIFIRGGVIFGHIVHWFWGSNCDQSMNTHVLIFSRTGFSAGLASFGRLVTRCT